MGMEQWEGFWEMGMAGRSISALSSIITAPSRAGNAKIAIKVTAEHPSLEGPLLAVGVVGALTWEVLV